MGLGKYVGEAMCGNLECQGFVGCREGIFLVTQGCLQWLDLLGRVASDCVPCST